jgi:putative ABC transport system permease protein
MKTTLVGTDESSTETRSFFTAKGRYLKAADIADNDPVCVLESAAAHRLFPGKSPLGETVIVRAGGDLLRLRVIGVMEKRDEEQLATDEHGFRRDDSLSGKGAKFRLRLVKDIIGKIKFMLGVRTEDTGWKRSERCVHVPLTLLEEKNDSIDWLLVKTDPLSLMGCAGIIQNTLVARNKEPVILYNLFLPILLSDQLKVKDDLTAALFLLCLFMGGIVIANVMLMSVMERSREIAIRRVEGASRKDIVVQFLTEGTVISVTGALLGIPLGLGLAYIASLFEPAAIATVGIPLAEALIAVACAVALGTLAAIAPARRAARLDPVVILQSE